VRCPAARSLKTVFKEALIASLTIATSRNWFVIPVPVLLIDTNPSKEPLLLPALNVSVKLAGGPLFPFHYHHPRFKAADVRQTF
jgi:hypothetical protein